MFELPEYTILAYQINESLKGKVVQSGSLGNSPHKFVWYNRGHEEFAGLVKGKRVGEAHSRGRWLFIALEPGYVLVLGECGGKVLHHAPGAPLPDKYHLLIHFTDSSTLSAMTQMWGAMELYEAGAEQERQYIKGMRLAPLEPLFTWEYFSGLIDLLGSEKRSAKALLTQEQLIPGLGNAIAQDILFRAGLHPRHPIEVLDEIARLRLYNAIQDTCRQVIAQGGRYDEVDLYGRPGGYVRLMDSKSAGGPCTSCGTTIQKMAYLGGACYFCPSCQT